MNQKARQKATSPVELDFYELLNNANCGIDCRKILTTAVLSQFLTTFMRLSILKNLIVFLIMKSTVIFLI